MAHRNGSLDILRALAILMVVACHAYGHFEPGGPFARAFGLGGRGVDLFFILSGWLLGHQLFSERRQTGTIHMPRFWLRRAMRTLPAYFAVLAFTLTQAVWREGFGAIDWLYIVFLQNYLPKTPYFGISWSLCVEEHFYLVVAPLVLLAGRFAAVRWFTVALLAVPTVSRVMGWHQTDGLYETHVRFDQCAAGVLLAWVAVQRPGWWVTLQRRAKWLAGLGAVAAAGVVLIGNVPWPWAEEACELAFWTLVFASWVLLANSSAWWAAVPNFRPTRFIADRAYSLYLVHIDAIRGVRRLDLDVPFWVELALTFVLCLALAELLYRLVERPGIRMREWFALTRSRREMGTVESRNADDAGSKPADHADKTKRDKVRSSDPASSALL
jgi:peptidoglycan/LPS O-acetylase OafA/YrhL